MSAPRSLFSQLRDKFPRLARSTWWLRPRLLRRRLLFMGRDREEIFSLIHGKRLWGSSESASGVGSTLEATENVREALPKVLSSLGARSLLDAPCGDFHWMREVRLDLDLYVGGEIVPSLVDQLQAEHGSADRRFVHLDITRDALPDADGFLCRDCLIHLSNREVLQVLDNAVRSSCSFLLASTYPSCRTNADIPTGFSRPLNLCLPPFGLPEPILVVPDSGLGVDEKCLGIWDLRALRRGPRP